MILRPRYSLLTLLILTAFIAGGVKLWYGPHWRTLSDPLGIADQALIAGPFADPQLQLLMHGEVRCKYRNTLSGSELLLIHGQPGTNDSLFVDEGFVIEPLPGYGGSHDPRPLYWVRSGPSSMSTGRFAHEKIRCWCSQPQQALPKPENLTPNTFILLRPFLPHLYFVTEKKRVYQLQSYSSDLSVIPIKTTEIDEPELRALIEQELASIPDP